MHKVNIRPVVSAISADSVRRESFGRVGSPEDLVDPKIFGPRRSWSCTCGRVRGKGADELVCSVCGVRVGDSFALRRRRWGHIDLPVSVRHPLAPSVALEIVPVIPIAFRTKLSQGGDLDFLYTQLLGACSGNSHARIEETLDALFCSGLSCRSEPSNLRSLGYLLTEAPHVHYSRTGAFLRAMCLEVKLHTTL